MTNLKIEQIETIAEKGVNVQDFHKWRCQLQEELKKLHKKKITKVIKK